MRILIACHANRSHLHVITPLAWALRTAGHDVRMASQPELAEDIVKVGFPPVEVGEVTNAFDSMPKGGGQASGGVSARRQVMPVQTEYARRDPLTELDDVIWKAFTLFNPESFIHGLVRFAKDWQPDLVLWDSLTYAAPVAARVCGAAHARVLWGSDAVVQLRQAVGDAGDPIRDWLSPILRQYGCEFDDETAVGQWTIDPMPPWQWRPEGIHYVPMRNVPYNPPGRTPQWLHRQPDRKRVCVTLGISHRDLLDTSVEASASTLFEAVDGLDIDVVATLNTAQTGPSKVVPDNVRIVDYVPLSVLLPTCSAIVHHGGSATFATAVENGIPQLIVPGTYWCLKWWGPIAHANGLVEQGAGLYVADAGQLTAEALRDDLQRVLKEESFQDNATRLQTEILGMPSPNDIVPVLERLTARHRGTHG